jgi:hypothetical protein
MSLGSCGSGLEPLDILEEPSKLAKRFVKTTLAFCLESKIEIKNSHVLFKFFASDNNHLHERNKLGSLYRFLLDKFTLFSMHT